MKPSSFEYVPVATIDEAVARLDELGDEAKVLAGGQSLLPMLNLRLARPAFLVDVNRVTELAGMANGSGVSLGAVVRHRQVERSDVVARANPLLARAAAHIGHTAIRNRGTIGGSVAHADPAAELPVILVALDGDVEARSARGVRRIPASRLFAGFLTTVLEPDELLTEVRFPQIPPGTGWSFKEFSRRSGDFGIVTVAATLSERPDGRVRVARIALGGVASTAVRAPAAEEILAGQQPSAELWEAAAHAAAAALDPPGDLHGSPEYRRHLCITLIRRALAQAHDRIAESTGAAR